MDPFLALGIEPGAGPEEIAAAYRRAAKRWHPDRNGGPAAAQRMAEINAAYAALRRGDAAWTPVPTPAGRAASRRADPRLGAELSAALAPAEAVARVVATSTWASPRTVLVLTDRRLLWLLQDAVTGRVASLRFADLEDATWRPARARRRRAVLVVRTRTGRRLRFGDLEPNVAQELVTVLTAR